MAADDPWLDVPAGGTPAGRFTENGIRERLPLPPEEAGAGVGVGPPAVEPLPESVRVAPIELELDPFDGAGAVERATGGAATAPSLAVAGGR